MAVPFVGTRELSGASAPPLIGLQQYTLSQEIKADAAGTLRRVAAIGYQEVELAAVPSKDLQKLIGDLGLGAISCHYLLPDLMVNLQHKIDTAKELGQEYMILTGAWVADPSRFETQPRGAPLSFIRRLLGGMTLDDWKWNSEQFNKIGEQTKKAGLQFGYHNHNSEFKTSVTLPAMTRCSA